MPFARSQIEADVVHILTDMTQDWDLMLDAPIGAGSTIVADLGFASVDIIHLVMALEEHFGQGKLGFEELLMKEGQYIDDLRVDRLVDFLDRKLNGG